jgi:hypothetical protein
MIAQTVAGSILSHVTCDVHQSVIIVYKRQYSRVFDGDNNIKVTQNEVQRWSVFPYSILSCCKIAFLHKERRKSDGLEYPTSDGTSTTDPVLIYSAIQMSLHPGASLAKPTSPLLHPSAEKSCRPPYPRSSVENIAFVHEIINFPC